MSEFQKRADEFLSAYIGVYAPGMWSELERRYRKLNRILADLKRSGRISSADPSQITAEDVKAFILYRRAQGLKDTSISHDLSAISNLCEFVSGNHCVTLARSRYPLLFAKRRRKLLPVLEKDDFSRIAEIANSLTGKSDPYRVRNYAMVMVAICGGLRTQEIQYAKACNLSGDLTMLYLDHVKGMNTYGEERTVPLRPEVKPILTLWLGIQKRYGSRYLFPAPDGGILTVNSMTVARHKVNDEVGLDFDFRMCRRTYAQYLVDEGLETDKVAVILGHSSVKTTEANYARPRDDRVVREVVRMWAGDGGQ